jgi:hypothetical protein
MNIRMIKKISLILLILSITFAISLKSTDFCIPKQQKECKGYYDRHKKYQIKCNTIKCHGTFSYDCGSDICSINMTECKKYNQIKHIINNPFRERIVLSFFKQLVVDKTFKLFNMHIEECKYRLYRFKVADYCLNGRNCRIIHQSRHRKIIEIIDCYCPDERNFKCGEYCTIDSLACDFYRSNQNKKYFRKVSQCANQNTTTLKTNHMIF